MGFAHEIYHLTIQIRQQPNGHPFRHLSRGQSPRYPLQQQQPVPSPSGGGRLGWGWLCDFRSNQIRAIRRTTLSPALSRRTVVGAGCKLKQGRLKTLRFEFGRNKLAPPVFRRPFIQSKQTWDNPSSVGFARKPSVRQSESGGCLYLHFVAETTLRVV